MVPLPTNLLGLSDTNLSELIWVPDTRPFWREDLRRSEILKVVASDQTAFSISALIINLTPETCYSTLCQYLMDYPGSKIISYPIFLTKRRSSQEGSSKIFRFSCTLRTVEKHSFGLPFLCFEVSTGFGNHKGLFCCSGFRNHSPLLKLLCCTHYHGIWGQVNQLGVLTAQLFVQVHCCKHNQSSCKQRV